MTTYLGVDRARDEDITVFYVGNPSRATSYFYDLYRRSISTDAALYDTVAALMYAFASAPEPQPQDKTSMNLSAAVMLFEENGVRPCKVEYDPLITKNNNPGVLFKCVDPSVKADDLVIVTTETRHGFTIAKVTAIGYADVPVDFENPTQWGWIAAKFDRPAFDSILASEKALQGQVSEANANKMRADLKSAMGLGNVSLEDVFIRRPVALASPHGTAELPQEFPSEPVPSSEPKPE